MPPINVDDWHLRLIEASEYRFSEAVRLNRNNKEQWRKALDELKASHKPIYIQKSGIKKNMVVNIPHKITNHAILATLNNIVHELEPVQRPQDENSVPLTVRDDPIINRRHYRDSKYAVLAALYVEYQGPGQNPQIASVLKNRAKKFTDLEIDFDYRTRKHGAWKCKGDLISQGFIIEDKRLNNERYYTYSLTLRGAKICYILFNEKFTEADGYDNVSPRHGDVDSNGNFTYRGGQRNTVDEDPLRNNHMHNFNRYNRDQQTLNRPSSQNDIPVEHFNHVPYEIDKSNHQMSSSIFSSSNSISKDLTSPEELRRKRLIAYNRNCRELIENLKVNAGLNDDEAWIIYEQDAENEDIIRNSKRVRHNSDAVRSSNAEDITDSQQVDFAIALSKLENSVTTCNKIQDDHMTDSQQFEFAIELSKLETSTATYNSNLHDMTDSQQLDLTMELSKFDSLNHKPSSSSSYDHEYAEALRQSKIEYDAQWLRYSEEFNNCVDTCYFYDDDEFNLKQHINDDETQEDADLRQALTLSMIDINDDDEGSNDETVIYDTSFPSYIYESDLVHSSKSKHKIDQLKSSKEYSPKDNATHEDAVLDLTCDEDIDFKATNSGCKEYLKEEKLGCIDENDIEEIPMTQDSINSYISNYSNRNILTPNLTMNKSISFCKSSIKNRVNDKVVVASIDLTEDDNDIVNTNCVIKQITTNATNITKECTNNSFNRDVLCDLQRMTTTSKSSNASIESIIHSNLNNKILQMSNMYGEKNISTISMNTNASTSIILNEYDNKKLAMLVDVRERNRQANYREFALTITNYISKRIQLKTLEIQCALGDFMLGYVKFSSLTKTNADGIENSLAVNSKDNKHIDCAGLIIERKTLKDIITRSAEKYEGPHFKQERRLRYCGLPHAFMLIEGSLPQVDLFRPRTSEYNEYEALARLDVISDRNELLGYMCGVLCRNFSYHQVKVLNTTENSADTTLLLTALTLMYQHLYDTVQTHSNTSTASNYFRKSLCLPKLDSFSHYWNGLVCNKRKEKLETELTEQNISENLQDRICRRFGDKLPLIWAYASCDNLELKKMLVCDLSLAPSNECEECHVRDVSCLGNSDMQNESQKVYGLLNSVENATTYDNNTLLSSSSSSSSSSTFISSYTSNQIDILIPIERQVIVNMCCNLSKYTQSFEGYPSFVIPTTRFGIMNSGISGNIHSTKTNYFPCCEIYATRKNTTTSSSSSSSSSLCVVVVPGLDIIEILLYSYDKLYQDDVSWYLLSKEDKAINVVKSAVDYIYDKKFDCEFKNQIENLEYKNRFPQIILLVENLGDGKGTFGACGKLKNLLNSLRNTLRSQSGLSREDQNEISKNLSFDRKMDNKSKTSNSRSSSDIIELNEHIKFSIEALQFIEKDLKLIINLFISAVSLYRNWQLFHVSDRPNHCQYTESFIGTLIHKMYQLALITYEN